MNFQDWPLSYWPLSCGPKHQVQGVSFLSEFFFMMDIFERLDCLEDTTLIRTSYNFLYSPEN